jgi:hypothetical protein
MPPRPLPPMGTQGGVVAHGYAGTLQGPPTWLDTVIPTNLAVGASGNNEDAIIMRASHLLLYESTPQTVASRVSPAGRRSLQIVLWEYVLMALGRYPASISLVQGTGMTQPIF